MDSGRDDTNSNRSFGLFSVPVQAEIWVTIYSLARNDIKRIIGHFSSTRHLNSLIIIIHHQLTVPLSLFRTFNLRAGTRHDLDQIISLAL